MSMDALLSLCVLGWPPWPQSCVSGCFCDLFLGRVVDTRTHRVHTSVLPHAVLLSPQLVNSDSVSPVAQTECLGVTLESDLSPRPPPRCPHSLFISHPNMSRIPLLTSAACALAQAASCSDWVTETASCLASLPSLLLPASCSQLSGQTQAMSPPHQRPPVAPRSPRLHPAPRPSSLAASDTPLPWLTHSGPSGPLAVLRTCQIPLPGMPFPQTPMRLLC